MINIREHLIFKGNAQILSANGEPIWYELMQEKKIDEIILLINNNLNVSKRNKNNDSWLLHCINTNMPNYILILGLNREDKDWFCDNNSQESPFFNQKLNSDYADIIGKKFWYEGKDWNKLRNKEGLHSIDFFEKEYKLDVVKRLKYWKNISLRR